MIWPFKNRKKYNGVVDLKLNNEYQIDTRNDVNFPGAVAYLELIDNAWASNMNEDEGALYIATLFYCGLKKQRVRVQADSLYERIQVVAQFGLEKGLIDLARWHKFSEAIENAKFSRPFI